jgi:hypothetical protein
MGLFRRRREERDEASRREPQGGCVVWDRAALAEYVADKAGFDAVGAAAEYVERVMELQNDIGRPAYVVEVSADIGQEAVGAISDAMVGAGVSCLLVPVGTVNVVAQLTPESMGVSRGGLYADMMNSARKAAVAVETIERQSKEG